MDDSGSFDVVAGTLTDVPEIMEVGLAWIRDLGYDPDEDMLKTILVDCIMASDSEACVILAKSDGSIVGIIVCYASKHPLHKGKLVALEPLWLVLPEYRGTAIAKKLLSLYEEWAKIVGCSVVFCGSFLREDSPLLKRSGYKPAGINYSKVI